MHGLRVHNCIRGYPYPNAASIHNFLIRPPTIFLSFAAPCPAIARITAPVPTREDLKASTLHPYPAWTISISQLLPLRIPLAAQQDKRHHHPPPLKWHTYVPTHMEPDLATGGGAAGRGAHWLWCRQPGLCTTSCHNIQKRLHHGTGNACPQVGAVGCCVSCGGAGCQSTML